jgi:hypothetical protein
MSAITDHRPLDLDAINARRKAAYVDQDPAAIHELVANDVADMLVHLRAARQPAGSTPEYQQVAGPDAATRMAADGWRVHTVLPFGGNLVYVMVRGGDTGGDTDALIRERDQLREDVAREQGRAYRAGIERDELAERVRRLRDIVLQGGQDAASVRRELLAEMTPGELLQVRRADPADGAS